jgi:hypothetical protein
MAILHTPPFALLDTDPPPFVTRITSGEVSRASGYTLDSSQPGGGKVFRVALRSAAVTLTLLACVQPPALVIETSSGDVVPLESWTATLSAPSAKIQGTATLAPGVTYRETDATITLTGAVPGVVHAWYVQLGECGHDRGILVGPQAYTPVLVDAEGKGRAAVTLPFTVPTTGHYFVTVRQSESVASAVIACGNLTKAPAASAATVAEGRS